MKVTVMVRKVTDSIGRCILATAYAQWLMTEACKATAALYTVGTNTKVAG